MLNFLKNLFPGKEGSPFGPFWKTATIGILILTLIFSGISGYHFRTGIPPYAMSLAWMIAAALFFIILFILFKYLSQKAAVIPQTYLLSLVVALITVFIIRDLGFRFPDILFNNGILFYLIGNSVLAGGVAVLRTKKQIATRVRSMLAAVIIAILGFDIFGLYWLMNDGYASNEEIEYTTNNSQPEIPNPSEKGSFTVSYFLYGSGTDTRRAAYRDSVRFVSPSVDASLILTEWKGKKAKWREQYWGFRVKEFPLNGRVWMPQSNEPAPLILIVHGNHGMEHYSDPGYAYLGKLLASRGFITVSIDENFINATWSGDFRGKEMPARAWLLLKHLELWRSWTEDAGHELYNKVDMNNIMLIGHSRGGEAVAIAAAFNRLTHFPDDASLKFDFNFNIRGLVAIAPTDKRYERRIKLENINYLSLQGSFDSDEASFFGLRQFQRIHFTDSNYWFKSGIYIHGANHGQFNTIWGRKDSGAPWNWILNLKPIISGEDQRQWARAYISAFAETTLRGSREYLGLFRGSVSAEWLPETPVLLNFKDSEYRPLVTFEEDLDVTTTDQGTITAINFKTWKEQEIRFRDDDTQGVNGVSLSWDYGEEMEPDSIASYSIKFDSAVLRSNWKDLVFNLSSAKLPETENGKAVPVPDFMVVVTDASGRESGIRISEIKKVMPPLDIQFLKLRGINKRVYNNTWEPALENIEIPFEMLRARGDSINNDQIGSIRLRFDVTKKGCVIINEIGYY